MKTFNKQIQTNVALNANVTSPVVPLKTVFMYSVACVISGTPNGTLKLQASNDPETDTTAPDGTPFPFPTHFVDIKDSLFTITSAGETMWNVREIGYNWVRVVYTDASSGTSTATMTTIFNGKVV